MGLFAVITVVVVVVAGGAAASYYLKQKRIGEWEQEAVALGLRYSALDEFGLLDLPFKLFTLGDGRGCENVIYGEWQGMQVQAFDYWYYTRSSNGRGGSSKQYHRFTCAVCAIPVRAPHTTVQRETVMSRLAGMVGFHDIDFESDEFNRAYQVRGEDKRFASYLIDARMMQWLLSVNGPSFELADTSLLCHMGKMAPASVVIPMGAAKLFRDHIPSAAIDVYKADA